jgi:hypothetical protein
MPVTPEVGHLRMRGAVIETVDDGDHQLHARKAVKDSLVDFEALVQ